MGPRGIVGEAILYLNLHIVLKSVVCADTHLADQKSSQMKSNYFNVFLKLGVIMQEHPEHLNK